MQACEFERHIHHYRAYLYGGGLKPITTAPLAAPSDTGTTPTTAKQQHSSFAPTSTNAAETVQRCRSPQLGGSAGYSPNAVAAAFSR